MGTHGHGKMEEHMLGNTAADVIRLSDTPVMVVRLPRETNRSAEVRSETGTTNEVRRFN